MQASHERYEQVLGEALSSAAELSRASDDAKARAAVFDDTVTNLVKAKMEHAQADVAMRAMRDEVDGLRAGQEAASEGGLAPAGGLMSPVANAASVATSVATPTESSYSKAMSKCDLACPCLCPLASATLSPHLFAFCGEAPRLLPDSTGISAGHPHWRRVPFRG